MDIYILCYKFKMMPTAEDNDNRICINETFDMEPVDDFLLKKNQSRRSPHLFFS